MEGRGTFLESQSGVSESELQSFANQHGIGGAEYSQYKNFLDTVGNIIIFFTTIDPDYMVWMHVEKE